MRSFLTTLALCLAITIQLGYADTAVRGKDVPGGGLVMTGQELSERCDGKIGQDQPDTFAAGTCLGYINGVAEMWLLYGSICYNNVTHGELSDTVVKYMTAHPDEVRRRTASVLVGVALKATYPVTAACRAATGDSRPVP